MLEVRWENEGFEGDRYLSVEHDRIAMPVSPVLVCGRADPVLFYPEDDFLSRFETGYPEYCRIVLFPVF